MSQSGLQAVSNPSEMFLSEQYSDSEYLAGLAVAVIMDGSRTFLIEIQVTYSLLSYLLFPFDSFLNILIKQLFVLYGSD